MDFSADVVLVAERVADFSEEEAGLLFFSNDVRVDRDCKGDGLDEVVFSESDFGAAFFSIVRFALSFLVDTTTAGESDLLRFRLLILNAGESVFASSAFFVAVVDCFLEDLGFSAELFDLLAGSFLAESVFS